MTTISVQNFDLFQFLRNFIMAATKASTIIPACRITVCARIAIENETTKTRGRYGTVAVQNEFNYFDD